MYKRGYTAEAYSSILGISQTSEVTILGLTFQPNCKFSTHLKFKRSYVTLINAYMSSDAFEKKVVVKQRQTISFSSIVLPNITSALSVYGASESELTIAQQFLDRCFKRRYTSKKLETGELLKVQDHRICRKVSSIPNHPLRANFPETKTTRYNLRNKSPAIPVINTDRFKNTFFNRIVFKYNLAL